MRIRERFGRALADMRWVMFVSRRFARVDGRGRSAATSALASLGIGLGVATLIVIISVMNGFQMGSIETIMEVSSGHVRCRVPEESRAEFAAFCAEQRNVVAAVDMMEAQALVAGGAGRQAAAIVRAVPPGILSDDAGFAAKVEVVGGAFDVSGKDSIVLGRTLAQALGVQQGGAVTLLALSGGGDVELISDSRAFTVTGIFSTDYSDINSSFAFVGLAAGKECFGSGAETFTMLKLRNPEADYELSACLAARLPSVRHESWRSFNRAFFGALRVEKNMLLLLLLLIFIVVGVNIYNGMRRLVFERREEIAVLSSLGGRPGAVQGIFVAQGLLTGAKGSLPGLVAGLALAVNMSAVFRLTSRIMFFLDYLAAMLLRPEAAALVRENRIFLLYSQIPARVNAAEVLCIAAFGIASALMASWAASRGVLRLSISEVLHEQ